MIKVLERPMLHRKTSVDLQEHHGQCEINYHRCMALIPGCRTGNESWRFTMDVQPQVDVLVKLLEDAPYTTTVEITQCNQDAVYLQSPRLRVRLYHDAEMAEVIGWNRDRHWLPKYPYPNKGMYQPDEKLSLNRFLADLLVHCRKLGIAANPICESIRINKN